MTTPLTTRTATHDDLPAIIALERQCASAAHWSEDQYQNLLEERSSKNPSAETARRLTLLIEENSKAVSSSSSELSLLGFLIAHHLDRGWEIENIAVAPAARRRGLGTMLVQELCRRAREANGESIFLEVRESNHSARALYEKLNFIQSGRRKVYYQNPLEDAILYRRSLP